MEQKRMQKNSKGITLIALVITIIVLLILAGISIMMLTGNNSILNKAKEAKQDTIEGEEIERVKMAYNSVAISKLTENNQEKVTAAELQNELENMIGKEETMTEDNEDGTLNVSFIKTNHIYSVDNGIVTVYKGLLITTDTENVIFTKKDGVTPGNPYNIETGDIVIYEDYEYRYNCSASWSMMNGEYSWTEDESQNGWGVVISYDKCDTLKTEYSKIYEKIFDKDVTNADATFADCTQLVNSPKLPNTIKSMKGTFEECHSLTNVVIPSSIVGIGDRTFYYCSSLENITIPDSITYFGKNAFYGCRELENIFIPKSVTIINSSGGSIEFYGCSKLKIYCEVTEAQTGWGERWNYYSSTGEIPVVYGKTRAEYESLVNQ